MSRVGLEADLDAPSPSEADAIFRRAVEGGAFDDLRAAWRLALGPGGRPVRDVAIDLGRRLLDLLGVERLDWGLGLYLFAAGGWRGQEPWRVATLVAAHDEGDLERYLSGGRPPW